VVWCIISYRNGGWNIETRYRVRSTCAGHAESAEVFIWALHAGARWWSEQVVFCVVYSMTMLQPLNFAKMSACFRKWWCVTPMVVIHTRVDLVTKRYTNPKFQAAHNKIHFGSDTSSSVTHSVVYLNRIYSCNTTFTKKEVIFGSCSGVGCIHRCISAIRHGPLIPLVGRSTAYTFTLQFQGTS
jgi:hypothetical protein